MVVRRNRLMRALPWACLFALSACGSPSPEEATERLQATGASSQAAEPAASATPPAPSLTSSEPLSCADEIGATAARNRADLCRKVSPATRPPCNIANSCAMIDDEIARSCALFDTEGEPMPGCGVDPKSKEAAAAVVQRYYSALNARDYGTAWQQWGEDGPPNQTLEKFQSGFADTRSTRVTIGKLQPGDAGAGSIYQPVPVTVDATLNDGTHQRFQGTYTVRRVNDVDGASAAQRRWHIDSAQLTPVR